MIKKQKRNFSPEQRLAAAERCRKMAADRVARRQATVESSLVVEGETAVAVLEKPTAQPVMVRDVTRVGSREVVLRVRTDGQMVSLQGPCLCGKMKREWHEICLKQGDSDGR